MKLQTNLLHRKGKQVNYIKLGITVQFDGDCVAEVNESDASKLLESDSTLSIADGEKAPQSSSKVAPDEKLSDVKAETEEEKVSESTDEQKTEENTGENTKIDLSALTVKALQEIAKEANLPSKEWATLNKESLIKYLDEKV